MLTRVVAAQTNSTPYNADQPNRSTLSGGNGGSVARASDTNILDGVSVDHYNAGVFGSTVLPSNDVTSAGGTLAYNNQAPIAKRLTTKINGVTNTFLLSGALVPSLIQSIHNLKILGMGYMDGTRTTKTTSAIRGGQFNIYNGQFDNGYPQHSDDYFLGVDNSSGDKAAKPSRAVPGTLTFKYGSPIIMTQNYSEKTG